MSPALELWNFKNSLSPLLPVNMLPVALSKGLSFATLQPTLAKSIGREKSAKELDCTELRVTSLSALWGWIITNPSH